MEDMADNVRQNIRAARERLGLSQKDVADYVTEHSGVKLSQATLSRIEAGTRQVTIDELSAISDSLTRGIAISDFMKSPDEFMSHVQLDTSRSRLGMMIYSVVDRLEGVYELVDFSGVPKDELLGPMKPAERELAVELRPELEGWMRHWHEQLGQSYRKISGGTIKLPKTIQKDDEQDEQKRSD